MRETRADTVQAFFAALALHALFFALAFFGLLWTRTEAPASLKGPAIEAELIDPDALSAATRRALQSRPDQPVPAPPEPAPPQAEEAAPPEQPQPEPIPEDSPEPPQPVAQERVPEPDTREQDAASAQAVAPKPPAEREQDARRRQEQIDLTERERQEEAERTRRLSAMEKMRQQQLADIRKQREQLRREQSLAEQKLRQLENARAASANAQAGAAASPPPGNEGVSDDLRAQYYGAIADAIRRNWTRPDNIPATVFCDIRIRQVPGGEVIDVEVLPSCPYDEVGRRSVEAAVLKAQPLPYAGFESVFSRDLKIGFKPNE